MQFGRRRILEREVSILRDALNTRVQQIVDGRAGSTATVARLPITVAARAMIADVAGALPLVAVRDGQIVTPTPSLVARPDPAMSRRRWVHRSAMSLTGWGNWYLQVLTIGANRWPLAAEVLRPDDVAPNYAADGWHIESWNYRGELRDLSEIGHVPLWELDLAPIAPSPLAACQAAFDDLAVLWYFAVSYWREGGKPPYLLKNPSRLKKSQALDALEQWLDARAQHRPGVLTGNWTLEDINQQSADDALLLDGLRYIDAAVARIYGMPPSLLNTYVESGSLTYSNQRDELTRWLNLSLYPTWLARIEDGLTSMLPYGQQAMFAVDQLGALGLAPAPADEGRGVAPTPIGGPTP